mgnify:CR=1 FL=1
MIFRGKKLFRLKVGLVLAGGGAKGAYQAGVIRALWDLDLIDNIQTGISDKFKQLKLFLTDVVGGGIKQTFINRVVN